ncbi:MAG: chemotaxis-specific protein-glutamate methyltransferase CheB [Elusimicrobiota bacterium]
MKKIRVLVVDDSPTVRSLIEMHLKGNDEIEVVGVAGDGMDAVEKASALKPDVITMDIDMPFMNGFEAIKKIMADFPVPILVISSSAFSRGGRFIFKALELGALEVIEKPKMDSGGDSERFRKKLIREIKTLSKARIALRAGLKKRNAAKKKGKVPSEKFAHVGIVSSTGGPGVLRSLLAEIPGDFPGCIFVVQHISSGFTESFIKWLNGGTALDVIEARERIKIKKGMIYVAKEKQHMVVSRYGRIELDDSPKRNGFRPSGDVLFESMSEAFGPQNIGVVLSGMGCDGAAGLKALKEAGGKVIAQDPEKCVLSSMPSAVVKSGVADSVVSPDEIAGDIIKIAEEVM